MNRELEAIYDELKRRLRKGEKSVFLQDDTLEFLKREAGRESAVKAVPVSRPVRGKTVPVSDKTEIPAPPNPEITGEGIEERLASLKEIVLNDPWCLSQVKPGKHVVFGVGDPNARIFFCGEAPGADEEIQGEPFVGPAGQLLTKIITAMGLDRKDVYIANIMNYRPPMPGPVGNRPPSAEEMAYCLPYLLGQLETVQPEVIVTLGKTAIDGLMGPDPKRKMSAIRGKWDEFRGIALMPTFHPSYLLRNQSPAIKRMVWEDMLAVMDRLGMEVSEKQRGYFR